VLGPGAIQSLMTPAVWIYMMQVHDLVISILHCESIMGFLFLLMTDLRKTPNMIASWETRLILNHQLKRS